MLQGEYCRKTNMETNEIAPKAIETTITENTNSLDTTAIYQQQNQIAKPNCKKPQRSLIARPLKKCNTLCKPKKIYQTFKSH